MDIQVLCRELKEVFETMCSEKVWKHVAEAYSKLPENIITLAYGLALSAKLVDAYIKCKMLEAICSDKTTTS